MDSSSSLFRSTLLLQKKVCLYGGEILQCWLVKHWKVPNCHQNDKPEACECFRQHQGKCSFELCTVPDKDLIRTGGWCLRQVTKMNVRAKHLHLYWDTVSALCRQQTHREGNKNTYRDLGMGEKLLLQFGFSGETRSPFRVISDHHSSSWRVVRI